LSFQGNVIGCLPGDLGSAGRFLGLRCSVAGGLLGGIAGGLLVGFTGNASQPGSVAFGGARIASEADSLSGGLSFGECRVVCPGSRTNFSGSAFYARARAATGSS